MRCPSLAPIPPIFKPRIANHTCLPFPNYCHRHYQFDCHGVGLCLPLGYDTVFLDDKCAGVGSLYFATLLTSNEKRDWQREYFLGDPPVHSFLPGPFIL